MPLINKDVRGIVKTTSVVLILCGILLLSVMIAVTLGSVDISIPTVYRILWQKLFGSVENLSDLKGMTVDIVKTEGIIR